MKKTKEEMTIDLTKFIESYMKEYEIPYFHIFAWMASTLVATLEINGYKEEFFIEVCERMKKEFSATRALRNVS